MLMLPVCGPDSEYQESISSYSKTKQGNKYSLASSVSKWSNNESKRNEDTHLEMLNISKQCSETIQGREEQALTQQDGLLNDKGQSKWSHDWEIGKWVVV